jgi:hypothetical protein
MVAAKMSRAFSADVFDLNESRGVARAEVNTRLWRFVSRTHGIKEYCKRSDFLLNLSSGMQTVIQVIATGTGSLRNKIMSDPQLEKKFGFIKIWHKQPGRPHGWAKIHSARDVHGAINLEWHARSRTLICRVVTKLGNKPNSIIGDFVDYLLARHQSRILAIHIMRR